MSQGETSFPARLLTRRVRVNAYGQTTAALAAFKFCAALSREEFERAQEVSPEELSRFFKRRGPPKARFLDEETAQNAQGLWVEITVVERRRLFAGKTLSDLSFGSARYEAASVPFDSPDAWAGAGPELERLKAHCQALVDKANISKTLGPGRPARAPSL